jgi:anti-sigma B factor antagonist
MSLKAGTRRVGDVSILDLSGRLTLGEGSGLLRATIRDVVNAGDRKIVINLRDVNYIDSAGLGELVGAYATASNAGAIIKLLHTQSRVRDLLQVTKLYTVFVTFEDEAEAVRSFAAAVGAGRLFL